MSLTHMVILNYPNTEVFVVPYEPLVDGEAEEAFEVFCDTYGFKPDECEYMIWDGVVQIKTTLTDM